MPGFISVAQPTPLFVPETTPIPAAPPTTTTTTTITPEITEAERQAEIQAKQIQAELDSIRARRIELANELIKRGDTLTAPQLQSALDEAQVLDELARALQSGLADLRPGVGQQAASLSAAVPPVDWQPGGLLLSETPIEGLPITEAPIPATLEDTDPSVAIPAPDATTDTTGTVTPVSDSNGGLIRAIKIELQRRQEIAAQEEKDKQRQPTNQTSTTTTPPREPSQPDTQSPSPSPSDAAPPAGSTLIPLVPLSSLPSNTSLAQLPPGYKLFITPDGATYVGIEHDAGVPSDRSDQPGRTSELVDLPRGYAPITVLPGFGTPFRFRSPFSRRVSERSGAREFAIDVISDMILEAGALSNDLALVTERMADVERQLKDQSLPAGQRQAIEREYGVLDRNRRLYEDRLDELRDLKLRLPKSLIDEANAAKSEEDRSNILQPERVRAEQRRQETQTQTQTPTQNVTTN